jgi:hypothetical protein
MDAARFPALTGEAVDGTAFRAPEAFAGVRTIALAGFTLDARTQVESWGPYLDALTRARPDVRARLFVVLGKGARLMRAPLLAGLRAALAAPELRANTIVSFDDTDAFCRALGITDRKHVSLFLIEPDCSVAWRAAGAYTPASGDALTAALAT